jgi:ferritin-like metal-binding protein YciE
VTKLATARDLFADELDVALAMEQSVLGLLERFRQQASHPQLRQLLEQHQQATNQQVQNLESAFDAFGKEPAPRRSPVLDGLAKRAEEMMSEVSAELLDLAILECLIETEHHEIAVYNGLIIMAETVEEEDLVPLFQENLEEEEQARDEAVKTAEQVSHLLALLRS